MLERKLGRSDIPVRAIGLGCLTIGGPFTIRGTPIGRSAVDDQESLQALQRAFDLGVNFFDTADMYGCGHSEQLLGQAFAGQRDQVIIATKFGRVIDPVTRNIERQDASPDYIRQACEASLRRLKTDYIDVYQFHFMQYDLEKAKEVRDVLEDLVTEGKVRYYGWSTDDIACARVFAEGKHCVAIQHDLNIFQDADAMLALCDEYNLASVPRRPLAIGMLTGKFNSDSHIPEDDVRRDWDFKSGEQSVQLAFVEQLQAVLTQDGRTLAQGALAWVLTRSEHTIPVPGFRTVAHVEENVQVLHDPFLSNDQMQAIADIMQTYTNQEKTV